MMVVYPGTFDPPHLGHLDIVSRAIDIFGEITIAVSKRPRRELLFSVEERVEMFKEMTQDLMGVSVVSFDGLLVDFLRSAGVKVILRGVRMFADFEYELQIALNNSRLGNAQTIFMMPSQEFIHVSSSIVRDIASHCGTLRGYVHPFVERKLREKFNCGA